jgi:chromate transport protein ChrA
VVYLVTLFWQHAEKSPLRHAIEKGVAPLTVGLILASAYIMGKSIDYDRGALLLTSLCALIFIFTRTNPLIIVALARTDRFSWLGVTEFVRDNQIGLMLRRIVRKKTSEPKTPSLDQRLS